MIPPPYPRTPYLWREDPDEADAVVPDCESDTWLAEPVVVEEKLDGANVSLWLDSGAVRVASRGGADGMDRAGQLGRLRAWACERHPALTQLLDDGCAVYGEWLWLEHSVAYDRLPDWLVVLDLWTPGRGLLDLGARDRATIEAGLLVPPRLFEGVLHTSEALRGLIGPSRFGHQPMEGVVLRRADGARCKVVRPGFSRKPDSEWRGAPRTNRLLES